MDIDHILADCRPSLPLSELVRALNLIYHEIEAKHYDRNHDEIWEQELPIFRELIGIASRDLKGPGISLLDYGCGTGFGCYQAARVLEPSAIGELVCVEPSESMLAKCRERLSNLVPGVRYFTDGKAFCGGEEWVDRFDLVITNSVLHHLYEWQAVLRGLLRFVKTGGYYLMGHEPSSRYYGNAACQMHYGAYLRERSWRRFLTLRNWRRLVRRKLRLEVDVLRETASAAVQAGLTASPLPGQIVGELVDYHVPHARGARSAQALEFEEIARDSSWGLTLVAVRSYGHIGGLSTASLPRKWRRIAELLSSTYPLDGASFCALWKKVV
jgi:ubiquinone/menaquinone biosynthesis C-methylase UbiE